MTNLSARGREQKTRRGLFRWTGIVLLLLVVLGWLYLVIAGKGLLIRYDPMATSEAEPRFVESVACTYSSGVRTETVLSLGHARDAECARLYKFGSVPPCPTPLSSPLLCQEVPK